jgi:hypothetical protein
VNDGSAEFRNVAECRKSRGSTAKCLLRRHSPPECVGCQKHVGSGIYKVTHDPEHTGKAHEVTARSRSHIVSVFTTMVFVIVTSSRVTALHAPRTLNVPTRRIT